MGKVAYKPRFYGKALTDRHLRLKHKDNAFWMGAAKELLATFQPLLLQCEFLPAMTPSHATAPVQRPRTTLRPRNMHKLDRTITIANGSLDSWALPQENNSICAVWQEHSTIPDHHFSKEREKESNEKQEQERFNGIEDDSITCNLKELLLSPLTTIPKLGGEEVEVGGESDEQLNPFFEIRSQPSQLVVMEDDSATKSTTDLENKRICEYILSICPSRIRTLVGDKLLPFVQAYCSEEALSQSESFKYAHREFFQFAEVRSKEEKERMLNIEIVLKAACVYYLSSRQQYVFDIFQTQQELTDAYPSFAEAKLDDNELELLLSFRNYMKVALHIIPAKLNKKLLIGICALLEGSRKVYVTGGAQVAATSRRVKIYEDESNIKPMPRAPRRTAQEIAESINLSQPSRTKLCVCECGSVVKIRNVWRHNRTLKHKNTQSLPIVG